MCHAKDRILDIHPKFVALAAAAALVSATLIAVPVLAAGNSSIPRTTPGSTAAQAVPPALMRARADVQRTNQFAMTAAPQSRSNACTATTQVAGLGRTCRTRSGLLGIKLDDGSTLTTHGADAPPLAMPTLLPGSTAAVNGATIDDISCVPSTEKRTVLMYVRPSNRPSRLTRIKPLLQQEALKMSAYLGAESRSVDPTKSKKIRFQCDANGQPTVLSATVRASGSAGAVFGEVVSDLMAQGYDSFNDVNGTARYLIYLDAPSATGAAGLGHFWNSTTPGVGSRNNSPGEYAMEFAWSTWSEPVPHWNLLLHEFGHNMGAVANAAANASGSGHCNDGLDIMCYADGGPSSHYVTTRCATEQFDCGRNDYFNPSPAAGSYLANNWNTAAPYNQYLDHVRIGDVTAPTAPGTPRLSGASDSAIGITWTPSTDDNGVVRYDVEREVDGAWFTETSTSALSATVGNLDPGTTYKIAVRAFDAAGNASARSVASLSTSTQIDEVPPRAPTRVALITASMTSIRLAWDAAIDDVGVQRYEVVRVEAASNGAERKYRSLGDSDDTSFVATGLQPNASYVFQVIAYDAAGNASEPVEITARTLRDTARPTRPAGLRAQVRGRRAVRIAWSPSTDNVRVTRYDVYRAIPRRGWVRTNILPASRRVATITRLRRHEPVVVRVRALDSSGNWSWYSAVLRTSAL